MKESLRRAILFTVIVITGSVMILFDVPLIILIPLILATGFIVLVLLGAITRSEIRSAFRRPQFKNLKKIGFLKRLDEMKFFEKKTQQPDKKPAPVQKKQELDLINAKKTGTSPPSVLSSPRSVRWGPFSKSAKDRRRKVEHINELLDKAVSEKVKDSALPARAKVPVQGPEFPPVVEGGVDPVTGQKMWILSCPCPEMNLMSACWTGLKIQSPHRLPASPVPSQTMHDPDTPAIIGYKPGNGCYSQGKCGRS